MHAQALETLGTAAGVTASCPQVARSEEVSRG